MTNKELIETAKQAMKDLWDINHGILLEHEQSAYNCLRLFCDRMEKIEQLTTTLKASKTEHELPNNYGFEYKRGFVSAINSIISRLNSNSPA